MKKSKIRLVNNCQSLLLSAVLAYCKAVHLVTLLTSTSKQLGVASDLMLKCRCGRSATSTSVFLNLFWFMTPFTSSIQPATPFLLYFYMNKNYHRKTLQRYLILNNCSILHLLMRRLTLQLQGQFWDSWFSVR